MREREENFWRKRGETQREREERKNMGIGEKESLCFPGRCGYFGSVFQETERGAKIKNKK